MVTYQEFRLLGNLAGYCDQLCAWTLRVYDDETLSASIVAASPTSQVVETPPPPIVLFNGQVAMSPRDASLVLRFHLVRHTPSTADSWVVVCKARLDPVTSSVRGTWSHWMAIPAWPLPREQMERSNQEFQLEVISAPVDGYIRSLRPLGVGRYEFRGVLVDEEGESVDLWGVTLRAKEDGSLVGASQVAGDEGRPLHGSRRVEACTWENDQGLCVEALVDTVLLLGEWTNGTKSGWLELVVTSALRQWRWEDHAATPETLQNAFTVCQQLSLQGVDDAVWRQIFSFCDYDWFSQK